MIRQVHLHDAVQIVEIYNYYILNEVATFEETIITAEEMNWRIEEVITNFPWLVYESENQILGYAYATKWKGRSAYRHSVEVSVYLKHGESGKGIGSQLYTTLFEQLKKMNMHAIMGGVSLPNEASVALHEKFGFKKVAHFKEVGFKFGKWVDVGYWQLIV